MWIVSFVRVDRVWKIDNDVPFGSERATTNISYLNPLTRRYLSTLITGHTLARGLNRALQHVETITEHDPPAPKEQDIDSQRPIGPFANPTFDGETITSTMEVDTADRGRRGRWGRGVRV